MKKNIGTTDSILRILAAFILAELFYSNTISGVFAITVIAFAGILTLTSLISFCPVYKIFGASTAKSKVK
ncbi:MAG: YgaP family membrane protein [Chitinophagaceae bacterium]